MKPPIDLVHLGLIAGATAGALIAVTIRARDPEAKVLIIGDEAENPYSRTPMSKELLWYGDKNVANNLQYRSLNGRQKDLFYEVDGFYVKPENWKDFAHGCVSVINGKKVWKVDTAQRTAILDTGERIKFDKCLIATGTRPIKLNVFNKPELSDHVHTLHTIADFRKLEPALQQSKSVAIIGDGILASELSYALSRRYQKTNDLEVVQIYEEDEVLQQILPSRLREDATKQMFKLGVRLLNSSTVQSADVQPNGKVELSVRRADGTKEKIRVDQVIVAVGAEPNVELAQSSDLKLDTKNGGILVNEEFRATPDIFSAGDVSSFNDLNLGQRRLEHVEHAEISGRVAGENMSGGKRTYPRQASWRSAVSPYVHFIGIGKVDSSMKTVVVLAQKDEKNGGILVNEEFRATPDIFSAGDVSSFNDLNLGQRRLEHVEHAEISGRVAGENMSGGKRTYPRQASWRSAVSPYVHFIGIGKVDSSMKTVVVLAQKDEKVDEELRAVAFYIENDKIAGVLLYNVFDDGVLMARKILRDGIEAARIPEVCRLFHLYPLDKDEDLEDTPTSETETEE
ncbi:Apoptosis-inducing factor 1, mitochondrial [Aphelenchoides besseyi]|nr:Apoptosis-inducing factor 1, mitochondrial [Aphelenchoides besseyi]